MNEPSNLLGAGTAVATRCSYSSPIISAIFLAGNQKPRSKRRRRAVSRRIPRQLNRDTSAEKREFYKADT